MMIAMLVSVVSMAGTPKKNFAPSNAVKSMLKPGFLQKKVDLGAERVSLKGKTSFKEAFRTVSDEPAVTPNELILASQYSYDELYGGMIIDYPVEVAYYVINDNNIILQLNDLLVLEGTIAIEEGNEVVTFKTGEVVATKTSTGEEFVLKCCDWDKENHVLVPNDNTITGYIFRDDAGNVTDIYIPVLQAQDETLTNMIGVVGSVSGVAMGGANYDMVAEASGRTWVAKVTGKDFPETQESTELTPFENEAGFNIIREQLYNHYSKYNVDDLWNKLNKAISDIKAYFEELDLESEMYNFVKTAQAIKGLDTTDFDKLTDDFQNGVTKSSIKITPLISLMRTYSESGIGFCNISGNAPTNNEKLKIALNGTVYELDMISIWYSVDEQGKGKFSYQIQSLQKSRQKSTDAKEYIDCFSGTFANKIQKELNRLFED